MAEVAAESSSIDRGYAWVIMAAAFGIQILTMGEAKSFAFLYTAFVDRFHTSAGATGWIMSLNLALLSATGSISVALGEAFTYRLVLIISGVVTAVGFICSAFATKMEIMYITYGLITGIGMGLAYGPSIVVVCMYFERRLALANGIAVAGSGIGYFAWPFIHRYLLIEYSLFGALLITGAICLNVCVLGVLMKPFPAIQRTNRTDKIIVESFIKEGNELEQEGNLTNHQRIDYGAISNNNESSLMTSDNKIPDEGKGKTCWTMCKKGIPDCTFLSDQIFWIYLVSFSFAFLGFHSNFAVLPLFAKDQGITLDSVATLISMNGLSDVCGRVLIGWVSDMQCLNRRYIFVSCMMLSGISCFMTPFTTTFITIAIYGMWVAFFGGSFYSIRTILLADAVGKERLPAALGLLLSLLLIPAILGAPFFGWLNDMTGNWSLSFIMAGVFSLLSAICIMLEPLVRRFSVRTYDLM